MSQAEGSLGLGGAKWAQKSLGGFLTPTRGHGTDLKGVGQQDGGWAAWLVVQGRARGFLTPLG